MPYDLRTELVGVVARHQDGCPARDGHPCRCGPLGYRAGVWDWHAGEWALSPLLQTLEEARDWQRAANLAPTTTAAASSPEEEAAESERLFWWAFCYVGLGFVGVAVALLASDIGH